MPAVAIAFLVLVALIVAALAFYLTWVVIILRSIHHTLGKVTFGVRAIAHRTAPLGRLVDEINGNLIPIADELEARVGPPGDPEVPTRSTARLRGDALHIPDHPQLESARQGSEAPDGA